MFGLIMTVVVTITIIDAIITTLTDHLHSYMHHLITVTSQGNISEGRYTTGE
jgi:hypothetical protein